MSPQQGERLLEEYRGENEQREMKGGKAGGDEERTIEEKYELLREDKKSDSGDSTTIRDYKSSSFDESSNRMVSSPAPVVEKGGENEFVRVSHLASVQVKAVPSINILKNKTDNPVRRILPRRSGDGVSLSSRSSAKKLRRGSNHKKYIGEGDDDDDNSQYGETSHNDESSVGNLTEIEKSPYEPEGCAEKGESIFEEMKALLMEEEDDNSQMVQMFGPTNAGCLVKANSLVEKSGMLYSQTWNKGTIRGVPVGIIPNHLLLMVLVPHRFVKASEFLLSGLCRDLEIFDSVNRGLDDWGWAKDYRLVRATKKNYKFSTNKRDCFKCAVFVARAHSCFLAFGKRELKPRLIKKLKSCLDIMEDHLTNSTPNGHNGHATSHSASASSTSTSASSSAKKRKKMIPDDVLSTSSLAPSSSAQRNILSSSDITRNSNQHQETPLKRKRGRPRKDSKHEPIQPRSSSTRSAALQPEYEENESIDDQTESASSRSKRHQLYLRRSRGGSKTDTSDSSSVQKRVSSSRTTPSLSELMSRFEDQYKEMGKRYAEMGTLLSQMKTAIEDNRERSEQEIRRELLDEIQRNILENMPKR